MDTPDAQPTSLLTLGPHGHDEPLDADDGDNAEISMHYMGTSDSRSSGSTRLTKTPSPTSNSDAKSSVGQEDENGPSIMLAAAESTDDDDFQDIFNELLHGMTDGDMDGLEDYLDERCMQDVDDGPAGLSADQQKARAWECDDPTDTKRRKEDEAEKMELAAMKAGKLPRPCIGTPSAAIPEHRRCLR